MIHEYALEPELVATWVDRSQGRYFIEKFGLGQPRVVSRYPRRWAELALEAFAGGTVVERKRLEELIVQLSATMVKRRDSNWKPVAAWLNNAEEEHKRVPFHAILARANPRGLPHVLVADELEDNSLLWALPHGRTVPRTAAELTAAVASMLRVAEVVVFIDPYFGPENRRHREPLRGFLRAIVDRRPGAAARRIEVQCSVKATKATEHVFRSQCKHRLPSCVPRNLRVKVVRLCQRPGGERLHNRYILTDLGGVMFGVGLDERDSGAMDDIHLLSRAQYEERWQQYASDAPAFDHPEPALEIEGSA